MESIKKNLITTTTKKQNKTHTYFPIYSLSLIFKVSARAVCLLTYLVLTSVLFTERYASVNSSCAQPPLPGYWGALAHLFSPGLGHLQISRCSGAGHLTTPGLFPSSWHARGFLSEHNYTGYYWKKRRLAHLSRTGGCKGMFSILCTHFFVAYQARITQRKSGAIDVNQRFLVGESNFGWYFFKNILSYL